MKNIIRNIACIVCGFIALWYAGLAADFFPFSGNDLALRAVGFTGLLVVLVVVISACWIVTEIRKK